MIIARTAGGVAAIAWLLGSSPIVGTGQTPSFTSGIDLVPVEFFAVTADGRPVSDLAVADVRLKVDGKIRAVRSLQWIALADPAAVPAERMGRRGAAAVWIQRDLGRIVRDTSGYYLVAFEAERNEQNGLRHRLDVICRCARGGVDGGTGIWASGFYRGLPDARTDKRKKGPAISRRPFCPAETGYDITS